MITTYIVKRYIVESYSVEIGSAETVTRKEIADRAEDPFEVKVIRETVKRSGKESGK